MDDTTVPRRRPAAGNPKLKRPCLAPILNPELNLNSIDVLLESLLDVSDSSTVALDLAFDRVVESKLNDEGKVDVIERAIRLGSALTEAAKRSQRRRASMHNAAVWALPSELTIKVFSLVDTQSVCHAAAACSFFYKCSTDSLCYSNIDLTSAASKANNAVASIMIQRAGKDLRSLKLGVITCPYSASLISQTLVCNTWNSLERSNVLWNDKMCRQGKEKEKVVLSRSCLAPLVSNGGASGALLERLYLHNIERMDNAALEVALSVCPRLLDLEIFGLHVELRQTLESVCKYCPLIERLVFESSKTGRDDCLKPPTCADLVKKCPHLSSLALRGFKLHDMRVRVLLKGLLKLKYVDFSTSYAMSGEFLRNLGGSGSGSSLEFLILRDCMHLKETEVSRLLSAILAGRFTRLRLLDVSNRDGLASEDDCYRRCYTPSFPSLRELFDEKPGLRLIADFPAEGSFGEESITSSDDSETNSSSSRSTHTSDGDVFSSSSESSSYGSYYSTSDQSSGNEEDNHPENADDEVDQLLP